MTKRLVVTPSAKVGITTVAFILVLVMVGIFLNKISCHSSRGYTLFFRFDSSRGLARGSAVQFAGVPIGEVQTTETTEDKGAKVEVLIFNKSQKIHRNAIAVITAESVLGGKIINITEPPSAVPDEKARDLETAHPTFEIKTDSQIEPGAEVRRVDPTGFEHTIGEVDEVSPNLEGGFRFTIQLQGDERIDEKDSVTPTHDNTGRTYLRVWPALQAGNYLDGIKEPEVTDIVVAVNDVIGTVNHLVSSLEPQIETITARLDTVLANVEQMLNKEDVAALLSDLRHTLQVTSDSVDGVTADVRSMLALSKDPLLNTLGNVEATTANLEAMTAQARAVSEDPETRDKLESLLTELEASSKSLHSILEDVEGITGDEAFVGDVKGTVASARATMSPAATAPAMPR
ncbi:MAG: MlaD family protein, partial [bacterium]